MAKKSNNNNGNGFPNKFAKLLGEEWMNEADAMDSDTLQKTIVEAESSIKEQERLRDADASLASAKETVKDLAGAYRDSIKYQTAKIKYVLKCLEDKGIV